MSIASAFSDVIRANWASCQLVVDLRTGSYQDLSSYARVVTLTNAARPPQWPVQTQGKGLDVGGVIGGTGYLSTPHAAELNLNPNGTIMCFVRTEFGMTAGVRYAWKRTGGVSAYDLYENSGAGALSLYDGATSHALGPYSMPTMRSIGASFSVGLVPLGYSNGVRLSLPASLWAPGNDVGPLYLANASTGGLGQPGAGWHVFLLFNARLTSAEISQLHNDFLTAPFSL